MHFASQIPFFFRPGGRNAKGPPFAKIPKMLAQIGPKQGGGLLLGIGLMSNVRLINKCETTVCFVV